MRKKSPVLLVLNMLLLFSISSPALAQSPYPVKDSTTTVVGAGGTDPGPGPDPGPTPQCSATGGSDTNNIDNALKNDFNVVVREGGSPYSDPPENVSCERRQDLYRIFRRASRAPEFKRRLNSEELTLKFYIDSELLRDNRNAGYTPIQTAYLWNGAYALKNWFNSASIWIIHETAHALRHRDSRLDAFPLDGLRRADNTSSYTCYTLRSNGWFLKSYSLGFTTAFSESQAEAIALYIYNSKTVYSPNPGQASIINFKKNCPNTYLWIKNKVFDGHEFN